MSDVSQSVVAELRERQKAVDAEIANARGEVAKLERALGQLESERAEREKLIEHVERGT
jgi:chromosome segregation ATPase